MRSEPLNARATYAQLTRDPTQNDVAGITGSIGGNIVPSKDFGRTAS